MKLDIEYNNRQIIPRWLPHQIGKKVFKINGKIPIEPTDIENLNHKNLINDWGENKSISYAIQLVASSEILGLTDTVSYKEALIFLKSKNSYLKDNLLLDDFLNPEEIRDDNISQNNDLIHKAISSIKTKLITYCTDSILWTDLAYFYTISGNKQKAEKCIRVALGLNSYNLHIIRSAARYYVYRDDPEQALHILRNSPSIKKSPMLLSSEISIAEAFNIKSMFVKNGQTILQNSDVSQGSLSELNATIATIEYNYGNLKKGKKYIREALEKPNENTLAQIQYLYNKNSIPFSSQDFDVPCQFEANAWNDFYTFQYRDAITESQNWFDFHPFSSRPVLLNSYIKQTIFDEHEEAVSIIDKYLKFAHGNSALLNNKAFSLAKLGKIDEAKKCIYKIVNPNNSQFDDTDKNVIRATLGLIEYSAGNPDSGRNLYKDAVNYFKQNRNISLAAKALYYWSEEEKSINPINAEKLRREAEDLVEKHKIQETKILLEKDKIIIKH
jgi:Flp pilus assembly protein TadD